MIVRLSKRAHNPLLKEAGLTKPTPTRAVAGRSVGAYRVPLTPRPEPVDTTAQRPGDHRKTSVS